MQVNSINTGIKTSTLQALILLFENKKDRRGSESKLNALASLKNGILFDKTMFSAVEPMLLKCGFNVTHSEAFEQLKFMIVTKYRACDSSYFQQWATTEMRTRQERSKRVTMRVRWELL